MNILRISKIISVGYLFSMIHLSVCMPCDLTEMLREHLRRDDLIEKIDAWSAKDNERMMKLHALFRCERLYGEIEVLLNAMSTQRTVSRCFADKFVSALIALVNVDNNLAKVRTSKELFEHPLVLRMAYAIDQFMRESSAYFQQLIDMHELVICREILMLMNQQWHDVKTFVLEMVPVLKKSEHDNIALALTTFLKSEKCVANRGHLYRVCKGLQTVIMRMSFNTRAIRAQSRRIHTTANDCEVLRLGALIVRDIFVPIYDGILATFPFVYRSVFRARCAGIRSAMVRLYEGVDRASWYNGLSEDERSVLNNHISSFVCAPLLVTCEAA
jgi:hypothetical protein